jgi:carboxypeptidase family protein
MSKQRAIPVVSFVFALAAALQAASGSSTPLRVSGRVVAPGGAPLVGAKLELWELEDPLDAARTRAQGGESRPAASAATDREGRYALDAPRAGAWMVHLDATGFVPAEWPLQPLVDSIELDDLQLDPDAGVQVRVVDARGAPVPSASIVAESVRDRFGWRGVAPRTRRALTGADGTVRLPRGDRESLDLSVASERCAIGELESQRGTAATLRVSPGFPATIEVVAADGARVAGADLFLGDALFPAGPTDGEGRRKITLPNGAPLAISALAGDGRRARKVVDATTAPPTQPIRVALTDRQLLVGRVIDAQTRRPVPDAVVWDTRAKAAFASTDAAGAFTLAGELGRLLAISAAAPGYLPSEAYEVSLLDDGRPGPSLVLAPGAAVEGSVVDGDGREVAGADVTLAERRAPGGMIRIGIGGPRSLPRARTDAKGKFRISSIDPEKSWELHARASGFAEGTQPLSALEPYRTKAGVRVALSRGRGIAGSVTDKDEAVLPGAIVRATKAAPAEGGRMIRMIGPGSPDEKPIEATTGDDGRFLVAGLPDGKFDLEIKRRGYAPRKLPSIEVGSKAETVDVGAIVLAPGETLNGHVRDRAGAPIEGAEIVVREAQAGPVFMTGAFAAASQAPDAVTDGAGFFSAADLSAERRYAIDVKRRGYIAGGLPNVDLSRGEPVDIVLAPASDIGGRVVDAKRQGVPGARVMLERMRTIELGGSAMRTIMVNDSVADAEGKFVFEDQEPGSISLSASAPGYQEAKLDDLAIPAGEDVTNLVLPLPQGSIVEGRVLGPDGRAAIGATVRALSGAAEEGPGGPGRAGVDGEGYYRLDGLAPGPVSIEATHEDLPRVVRDIELREGRNALDLAFSGGTEVSGIVRDDAGNGVAEAAVSLVPAGRTWGGNDARTASDGSFRFLGVTPGSYRARADAQGFASGQLGTTLEVTDQPLSGLQIALSRGGSIAGTIRGVEAQQLADVSIEARGGTGSFGSAAPDYRGQYRVEHLTPGRYSVQARLGSTGRQASGEVTVEADADARLDIEFGSGVTLSGVARAGDAPIPGATLFVEGKDVDDEGMTRTDDAGRFVLEGLDPGTYRVDLHDFVAGLEHSETVALATSREIVLRLPANRIAGTVVDSSDRQPLAGVTLALTPSGAGAGSPRAATTDIEGRFSLASVPDGEFRLSASRKGYAAQTTTVAVTNAKSVEDVRLALDATEGLVLEVRLPSGAVPSEVQVAVLDPAGSPLVTGHYTTGENGSVRLSSVPPGEWTLLVSAPGAATSSVRVRAPAPKVQIALRPATSLAVEIPQLAGSNTVATAHVRDAAGTPFRTLGWSGTLRAEWPVAGGKIEFGSLPPDTWTVDVATSDGRKWSGTATTTPAAKASLVLDR